MVQGQHEGTLASYPAIVKLQDVEILGRLQVEKAKSDEEQQQVWSTEILWLIPQRGRRILVNKLEKLKGHVRIDSSIGALEFVRFRSSVETFNLFRKRCAVLEILSEAQFRERRDNVFERMPWHDFPRKDGRDGVVRQTSWDRFSLEEPRVATVGSSFLVSRFVVVQQLVGRDVLRHEFMAYKFVERVGRDGSYEVLTKVPRPDIALGWHFESRENERSM